MSANQTQQILRQEFHLPNQSIQTNELLNPVTYNPWLINGERYINCSGFVTFGLMSRFVQIKSS